MLLQGEEKRNGYFMLVREFYFFRNRNFLKTLAMITKPHVANVSTVWELLSLLPTTRMASRVPLGRKSRKPKKERDNMLIAPKAPNNHSKSNRQQYLH